jgi:hypothetical protein
MERVASDERLLRPQVLEKAGADKFLSVEQFAMVNRWIRMSILSTV